MVLRVGLPLVGGRVPEAAKSLGVPVLVSANALAVYQQIREPSGRRTRGPWSRWRTAPDLDGMDVALDSAGFVAWSRYGGFPWTVRDYLRLVTSRPWTWWAQMDACCEPEVASSPDVVRYRQAVTARLLHECRREAARVGAPPPMPVLQGWTPEDYVRYARSVDLRGATTIGVGSMCRRQVRGPNGLVAVVDALDAVLPSGAGLHLFGVKSQGLAALHSHPRVASADSMAWDYDARRVGREAGGTSMDVRTESMARWYRRQAEHADLLTVDAAAVPRRAVRRQATNEWQLRLW